MTNSRRSLYGTLIRLQSQEGIWDTVRNSQYSTLKKLSWTPSTEVKSHKQVCLSHSRWLMILVMNIFSCSRNMVIAIVVGKTQNCSWKFMDPGDDIPVPLFPGCQGLEVQYSRRTFLKTHTQLKHNCDEFADTQQRADQQCWSFKLPEIPKIINNIQCLLL